MHLDNLHKVAHWWHLVTLRTINWTSLHSCHGLSHNILLNRIAQSAGYKCQIYCQFCTAHSTQSVKSEHYINHMLKLNKNYFLSPSSTITSSLGYTYLSLVELETECKTLILCLRISVIMLALCSMF